MPRVFLRQILWHSKDNKHPDRVYSVDWQPRGNRLATAGADEFVHIWCVEIKEDMSLTCISRLLGHESEVNCARWSPMGNLLVSGGADKNVIVWKKSEKPENVPLGYDANIISQFPEFWNRANIYRCSDSINTLCWSPDGLHIAVALEDAKILILNLSEDSYQLGRICVLEGHTHMIQGIAWDPLNEFIVSQSCDQTVRVWNRKSDGKNWKLENVIKNAKEKYEEGRGNTNSEWDSMLSTTLDGNPLSEKSRQNRSLFYPESILPSFFRRLDWSPDGTIFIAPAGIQFLQPEDEDKGAFQRRSSLNSGVVGSTLPLASVPSGSPSLQYPPSLLPSTSHNSFPYKATPSASPSPPFPSKNSVSSIPTFSHAVPTLLPTHASPTVTTMASSGGCENLSVSYAFHRKLITVSSTPFVTQKSMVGVPVTVRFNPVAFRPLMPMTMANAASPTLALAREGSAHQRMGVSFQEKRGFPLPERSLDVWKTSSWLFPPVEGSAYIRGSNHTGQFSKAGGAVEEPEVPSILDQKEGDNGFPLDTRGALSNTPPTSPIHAMLSKRVETTNTQTLAPTIADTTTGNSTSTTTTTTSTATTTLPSSGKEALLLATESDKCPSVLVSWPGGIATTTPLPSPFASKASPVFPKFVYAVGTLSGQLLFYDTQCFQGPLAIIKNLHLAAITDLAWSNDGYCLAASSSDGYVTIILFDSTELGEIWLPAQVYSTGGTLGRAIPTPVEGSVAAWPPASLSGGMMGSFSGGEKRAKLLPVTEEGNLGVPIETISDEAMPPYNETISSTRGKPSFFEESKAVKGDDSSPMLLRVGNAVL